MDGAIAVDDVDRDPVAERSMEFVERKGIGHPDSICDGVAEAVSRALSRYYLEEFGRILHHNTDKVHLGAGRSAPAYGGGEVEVPSYLLVGGRATRTVDGRELPIDRIATEAARDYLEATLDELGPDDVEVEPRIGETSTDLRTLFERDAVPRANDTSFGVGHAPLSTTERIVRTLEPRVRGEVAAVGDDVKIMAARVGDRLSLTIAAAVVDRHVGGLEEYRAVIEEVRDLARRHARDRTEMPVTVIVNAADDLDAGSVYLTVTGLSAEMGDDGGVGRGNRANGLITPNRSMSLEATAGKNPVTHVGNLNNLAATRIAERIAGETGTSHSGVQLLSQIGAPITDPKAVHVATTATDHAAVRDVVTRELADIQGLTEELVRGELRTF